MDCQRSTRYTHRLPPAKNSHAIAGCKELVLIHFLHDGDEAPVIQAHGYLDALAPADRLLHALPGDPARNHASDRRNVLPTTTPNAPANDAAEDRTGTCAYDAIGSTFDHHWCDRLDMAHLDRLCLPRLTPAIRGSGQGRLRAAREYGTTQ